MRIRPTGPLSIISLWFTCLLPFWFVFKCGKSIFSFVFLGVRKGAGINFHHMYTEIIKSKSTFEYLPITYTILSQLSRSFYGLGKLVLRATFISLTC